MIILENVGVAPPRKINQRRSAGETHCHPERELMRRSYVNYFWRTLFRRSRDRDSLCVDRPWHDRRPCKSEGSASLVKTRILNPRNIAAIHQCHRANHHCLLRSSGDDDLIRMAARASMIAQVRCYRIAQLGIATARRILQQMRSFLRENLCSEPFPSVDRKFIERGDSWNKGDA